MKRIFTLSTILALILTGCASDPVANFAFSPGNPFEGQEVLFDNLSLDAESVEWNFGDGESTNEFDPIHIFTAEGSYIVELVAFGKRGGTDVKFVTINVEPINDPVANFTYTPGNPFAGQEVLFDNISLDAESFEWDFGDGTISSVSNPVHTYMSGGTYTVKLKAFGMFGAEDTKSTTINVVLASPFSDFSVYTYLGDEGDIAVETDIVFVGEEVEFYNYSEHSASYSWNFGDGYSSDLTSPTYSYDSPGTYQITLKAYGYGSENNSYTKTIEVVEGVNSALRITVLEYYDEYPVENASVLLFKSVSDWETHNIELSDEVFTTALGKCVFEGMDYLRYYVDVWEKDHDNYLLKEEDVGFIETQALEPGYIHDFIAYVDYYAPEKKVVMTRIGKKQWAKEKVSDMKASEVRTLKENKFSQEK